MDKGRTYAGIDEEYSGFEGAEILLQSIPWDGTSTWGKGADKGFEAFMEASENMELYDIETDSEVYRKGIYIMDPILEKSSPEKVYQRVYERTCELLKSGKFLSFFGGEHSVSIGIIEAFYHKYPDLTVLQLDAHADLRERYLGSEYNHACALHKASLTTNLIQVGIRSMDVSEKKYLKTENCFFAHEMHRDSGWMDESLKRMGDKVYLTIDLDVLDPSVMPATGTPEPGGMDWYTLMSYLKKVSREKEITGFDIVEFAPLPGHRAPDFLVAKLYYKLLSYIFYHPK